ncbi:MAG: SDR family oxidoreductase [Clostridiales bacterium]|jgi:3-oxoacyl-[acyl-carrier protein] reductase|nr:SDR family oxidoreductase [Clostridiales bacterium]
MKKTVLITGASRGIGASTAEAFAADGYSVIINYNKSKEKAEAVKAKILSGGGSAEIFKCDVSDEKRVREMTAFAMECYGSVDVLVNNAGIAHYGLFTDLKSAEWKRLCDVNITGALNASKAALEYMIPKKSGNIINISSVWGVSGASCEVAYSTVKAAVIGFTKALSKELGLSGIRVNCIAPGVIDTDMNKNLTEDEISFLKSRTSLNAVGIPSDIAKTALFLASEDARYITGQVITVDGGFI